MGIYRILLSGAIVGLMSFQPINLQAESSMDEEYDSMDPRLDPPDPDEGYDHGSDSWNYGEHQNNPPEKIIKLVFIDGNRAEIIATTGTNDQSNTNQPNQSDAARQQRREEIKKRIQQRRNSQNNPGNSVALEDEIEDDESGIDNKDFRRNYLPEESKDIGMNEDVSSTTPKKRPPPKRTPSKPNQSDLPRKSTRSPYLTYHCDEDNRDYDRRYRDRDVFAHCDDDDHDRHCRDRDFVANLDDMLLKTEGELEDEERNMANDLWKDRLRKEREERIYWENQAKREKEERIFWERKANNESRERAFWKARAWREYRAREAWEKIAKNNKQEANKQETNATK